MGVDKPFFYRDDVTDCEATYTRLYHIVRVFAWVIFPDPFYRPNIPGSVQHGVCCVRCFLSVVACESPIFREVQGTYE